MTVNYERRGETAHIILARQEALNAMDRHMYAAVNAAFHEFHADDAAKAKLFTSELEGRVTDECLQLHGGAGYMDEYPISRMYANARISRIYAGSSEIMREIIARSLGLDPRKKSA